MAADDLLRDIYTALYRAFGHRHWWPADSPFEVTVGAVLTQNTNWANVAKAIGNLNRAGLLRAQALDEAGDQQVQELIRPTGYFRQKAARLKRLAHWIRCACGPDDHELTALRSRPVEQVREELLSLSGIGPETADSILLYALDKPVFVVDAYTVRVLARHQLIEPDVSYDELQAHFHDRLPSDVALFQDFHAQLVEVGKRYCKRRASQCRACPLHNLLGDPVGADEYL